MFFHSSSKTLYFRKLSWQARICDHVDQLTHALFTSPAVCVVVSRDDALIYAPTAFYFLMVLVFKQPSQLQFLAFG